MFDCEPAADRVITGMASKELFNEILYPQPTDYSSLGYCISYLHCAIMYMSAKKLKLPPL